MATPYTVTGVWQEETPLPVSAIAGTHDVCFGPTDHFEDGLWVSRVKARTAEEAMCAAIQDMLDYRGHLCRTPGCAQSTVDGEGEDGRCTDCTDRIEGMQTALHVAQATEEALTELRTVMRRINFDPADGRLSGIGRIEATDRIRPLLNAAIHAHAAALTAVGEQLAQARTDREEAERQLEMSDLTAVMP